MTDEQFAEALKPLVAATTGECSPATKEAYFRVLKDLPVESVKVAIFRHLAEAKDRWLPAVGLLRGYALEWMNGTPMSHGAAWDYVIRLVRQMGIYQQQEAMAKLPATLRAAIGSCGGWQALCDMEHGARGVMEAQFRKGYLAALEQKKTAETLPAAVRPKLAPEYQALLANTLKGIGHEPE